MRLARPSNATIRYTNWRGEIKTWNPHLTNFHCVVRTNKVHLHGSDGSYFSDGAFMFGDRSLEATRVGIKQLIDSHPSFNWSDAGLRLVKAPCLWDAPQTHILIEHVRVAPVGKGVPVR